MNRSPTAPFQPTRRALTLAAAASALLPTMALSAGPAGPASPTELAQEFARAFNARDLEALLALYPEGSVFVPAPGRPLVAREAVRQALQGFLGIGLPIKLKVRHAYEAGDTALLVVDWAIQGTGADGRVVSLSGTGTDIARRGADGRWRYLVDNPFGVLKPAA